MHYSLDVVCHKIALECESTLCEANEKQGGAPRQKPRFDSASLFLLPITSGVGPGQVSSTRVLTKTIEYVTGYPRTYTGTSVSELKFPACARGENKDDLPGETPTIVRGPQSRGQTTKVWMETSVSLSPGHRTEIVILGPVSIGRIASVVYRPFTELQNRTSPPVCVHLLNFYENGRLGHADPKPYYNHYVASSMECLPIAVIAYGSKVFPHVPGGPKRGPTKSLATTLEVKWGRVALAAGTIVASQILVIMAVLYYCRNVFVPEDRYLTAAELVKPVLNNIDDGTMMTGEEFESALDGVLGGPFSYSVIPSSQGDQSRVALSCEAASNFLRFPPFRKLSIFRR